MRLLVESSMAFGSATCQVERGSVPPTRRRSAAKDLEEPDELELDESCDLWELQHQRQLQRLGAHWFLVPYLAVLVISSLQAQTGSDLQPSTRFTGSCASRISTKYLHRSIIRPMHLPPLAQAS